VGANVACRCQRALVTAGLVLCRAVRKTTLDGVNQRDYLEGKSEKSARDVFYYISGATPSAVRYKNWKMNYTMSQSGPAGWLLPLISYHMTQITGNRQSGLGAGQECRSA
jgi:hypothetical protein